MKSVEYFCLSYLVQLADLTLAGDDEPTDMQFLLTCKEKTRVLFALRRQFELSVCRKKKDHHFFVFVILFAHEDAKFYLVTDVN